MPANNHQAEAEAEAVAMVCLQAQQVAGLPDAAEGRHIQVQRSTTTTSPPAAAAVSVCRAGVADFHSQVLLLHCAPVNSLGAVAVTVTMLPAAAAAACCNDDQQHPAGARIASVDIDLAEQLRRRRPCLSPSVVLRFVLGVSGGGTSATATTATAAAGAVLSLALHHRLTTTTRTGRGCSLLRSCLRLPPLPLAACCRPVPMLRATNQQNRQGPDGDNDGDGDGDSSGFITIEKGTISRRRPPSDYLLTTTDDDEVDNGKRLPGIGAPTTTTCCWSWDDDTKVENDFLAMLMLEDDDGGDGDDLDLDALIKDAEADLAAIWPSRG